MKFGRNDLSIGISLTQKKTVRGKGKKLFFPSAIVSRLFFPDHFSAANLSRYRIKEPCDLQDSVKVILHIHTECTKFDSMGISVLRDITKI